MLNHRSRIQEERRPLARPDKIHIEIIDGKGRGVFASQDIAAGTTIEASPVIVLKSTDGPLIKRTVLDHYVYEWIEPAEGSADVQILALVLGYGSLFNHSGRPNASFQPDHEAMTMVFTALRLIKAGEEVVIDYEIPLWFETVE